MTTSPPRAGYTLPVFACAAAIAALQKLQDPKPVSSVWLNLVAPPERVEIVIEQVACLQPGVALAITRSDPGDNLDLTRNTPIWALVAWGTAQQAEAIVLEGGEGIGRLADGQAALYAYAKRLLLENLLPLLPVGKTLKVTVILPEGRQLATRTSNAAFGVVEGLSLLGTSGISQPLSAPGQLEVYRETLKQKQEQFDGLVFCIGENGLDLAQQLGVQPSRLVKTANWLGPMLVEAALQEVEAILLFGYHGKLLKLAGGIFHTHHHVADGRLEILTAHCAKAGVPMADLQIIFTVPTAEDGLKYLRNLDGVSGKTWTDQVYGEIAEVIDHRSQTYVQAHTDRALTIGSVLFDRQRKIITTSKTGAGLLKRFVQSG
jgi:cobalt-precorrin-5B (C1)-methyltransferase